MDNKSIYFVHGKEQNIVAPIRYSLGMWLKSNHIHYVKDFYTYFVVDENGRRTGEVYAELNAVPTDDPVTFK